MKKFTPLAVAASLILLVGAGCMSSSNTSVAPTAGQGTAVFTITDDSSLTDVSAVDLTVDKLEVHSAAQGWVTVSNENQSYDLLKLKADGVSQLLAQANLEAGTYDQVRLNISKVDVTAGGKTVSAKLPSRVLKIVGNLTVVAGQTSTASLDFMVDKSLHVTGDGDYILAPVVKWETTKHADVTVKADDSVEVEGGEKETEETIGVDENGEAKVDFELPEKLELDANGNIKIED